MTSRRSLPSTLLAVVLATASIAHAQIPEGCLLEAKTTLNVDNGATLDGGLLVRELGGKAKLGRQVFSADGTTVTGDLVRLGRGTSVFDVRRGILKRASDAIVRGTDMAITFPEAGACTVPELTCGSEDVHVEKLGSRVVLPGSYGDLAVEDGGHVIIAPGAYAFCSIRTGRNVILVAGPGAQTSFSVVGDLVLGDGTQAHAADGTAIPTIDVGGTRVKLPRGGRVDAFVRSPLARLSVGRTTVLTGGACARTIKLARQVAFECADGTPVTTTTTTIVATTSSTSTSTTGTAPSTTTTSSTIAPTTTTSTVGTTSTSSTTTMTSTSSTSTTGTGPSTTSSTAAPPTSTSSTTTSTIANTTSTSTTSSSTSTTGAPATTSLVPTTSTTSTSTTTSTSSTTSPAGCGNGATGTGETCDDGNNSDNDACPADCRIAACTPGVTTERFVQIHFEAPLGALVAGITVLVDYPEGLVDLPGNGTTFPSGVRSGFPPGATVGTNDLNFNGAGHAVRVTVAGQGGSAIAQGQLIRFRYQDCQGATPPTPQQFPCSVISAADPFLNPVSGVRCFVVIE